MPLHAAQLAHVFKQGLQGRGSNRASPETKQRRTGTRPGGFWSASTASANSADPSPLVKFTCTCHMHGGLPKKKHPCDTRATALPRAASLPSRPQKRQQVWPQRWGGEMLCGICGKLRRPYINRGASGGLWEQNPQHLPRNARTELAANAYGESLVSVARSAVYWQHHYQCPAAAVLWELVQTSGKDEISGNDQPT